MSSSGNHIEAKRYHEREMATYQVELSLSRWNERQNEKLLLKLNRFSNNHGLSWWQGLKFTFLITLGFYVFYLITLYPRLEFNFSSDAIGYTIRHFIELINLTFWDFKPFGIDHSPWGYLILFIGRIFIGYGYYQLIQAFRKYGKN